MKIQNDKYLYYLIIYIISMKEKMEEKIGKKREKGPYEKPAFGSEELFETAVLACTKTDACSAPRKNT